jgi:hypothetical protein
MRSSLGRLVGRGALLAALGFGGFGSVYGATAQPQGDVPQLADFSWNSIKPDFEPDAPVVPTPTDDSGSEIIMTGFEEDFSWN